MVAVVIAIACLGLLTLNEHWWRRHRQMDEFSRKFVHIGAGCFVATWPYFLSWNEIRFLSVAALLVVLLSKYLNVFKTIHGPERATWGELFFAVAIGATTFVTNNKGIYAVAILQMALADGLAAVVGMRYGKSTQYKMFGHIKSLVGTATFLVVSYVLLLGYAIVTGDFGVVIALSLTLVTTVLENVSVLGLDNLLVPVLVAFAIRLVT